MAAQSGSVASSVCLLLLAVVSLLTQEHDGCNAYSHCPPNWLNGTYYIRPEGSENASCPAQPCLTPSQLRDDFFTCDRYNSCQTANTSLVLLPGIYTIRSNHTSFFPPTNYFSLTGYDKDCSNITLPTAIIDCGGTWISLPFRHIKCVQVYNCVVFTGHGASVIVDRVIFNDTLIRMASITVDDYSDLDYNHTLTGSLSGYCLLQKQLGDSYISMPSNSTLVLRNVSFSSDYHSTCARDYGVLLTTIYASESVLDIADCTFSQNIVQISLNGSTLRTSGIVEFENASTAIKAVSSTIDLAGTVTFINNENSAIQAVDTYSTITLTGTVKFINNSASYGGAIVSNGSLTIDDNAQICFQSNHADDAGGAIFSFQHVTLAGTVKFINNSANQGGAIDSNGNVTVAKNAQVIFQENHAGNVGGAIVCVQYVTLAGTVKFVNNTSTRGGAIVSIGHVMIADNAQVVFQDNHADDAGGAIFSFHEHVSLAGIVKFINNTSANHGGAIVSNGNVTIADNAQVVFQGNHADGAGGAIVSIQHVTVEGTVKFINNTSAYIGGAIASISSITISNDAQVLFQGNHADSAGGAIISIQHVTLEGIVKFINNSAYQGGGIASHGSMTMANNVVFQGNHADHEGGAILSFQHVTLAGTVKFINNTSANQGGAIVSNGSVTIADNAEVFFQGNQANYGGASFSFQHTQNGAKKFINNSAYIGGAIGSNGNLTIVKNARVVFHGNHAGNGGAIFSFQQVILEGTVKFINNTSGNQGGAIVSIGGVTIADNAQVDFQGNHADGAGGAIVSIQHVTVDGTVKFINNTSAYNGGAIASLSSITISDDAQVLFQGNHADSAGGAIISIQHVTLEGTMKFINNSAYIGGAITCNASLTIADNSQVVFESNHADNGGGAIFSYQLTLAKNAQVIFQGNYAQFGGVIFFLKHVVLAGTVKFINNTALVGGAIFIYEGQLTIANYAHVIFKANHADHVGGAIFSSETDISLFLLAGIRDSSCRISSGVNCTIEFIDNTAKSGGSAMYGITVSKFVCGIINHSYENVYDNLFDIFTIIPDDSSAVSSEPLRVCICSDQFIPDCLAILPDQNFPHLHYTVYPGQNFTVPAAVVGFNFALTSGSVYTQFLNSDASLASESQYVQGVSHTGCSQLQYSILSDKKQETLVIKTNGRRVVGIANSIKKGIGTQQSNHFSQFSEKYTASNPNKYYIKDRFATNLTDGVFRLAGYVHRSLQDTPVFVSLTLLDCPPGFTLSDQPHSCNCNERLLKSHLTCNITDQTIRRHTTIWVNASFIGNTSNGIIIHKHCPFEYCKPEQLDVNLTHPEIQCAFNHYGTLCGACKPGLSLALGSSQCLSRCSNKYLSLLIPFGLAGFALVFFIKILNLTVSHGTINGLIFYANIVAANQSILFPVQYNKFLSFLSIFISWLNLDLGIETCFIKGLDGYWKTWLQFVFPFYVWVIAGAIVLVSHYSTRATKIFGDNSVSVLATLFLLSYAKLLRSIITILSFTTLEYPDNFVSKVWAFDGNIRYLSPKHIPLFLFAFAIVLLLWLPYTVVLLCAQWLRTQSHRKGLRWLKPFLDAYYGPFKDKHHYWVGVLLVVRGVLFVFFASFFAIENNVNLLMISISCVSVLMYASITGRLYKKIYQTVLANSFFLNLAVLAAGTFYIRLVGGSQEALVTTSIGTAFIQFFGITIFHSYHFVILPIRKWYLKLRAVDRIINDDTELELLLNSDSSDSNSDDEDRPRNAVTYSEVRLSELQREAAKLLLSPATADYQLQPAEILNNMHREEILIPFDHDTPQANIDPNAAANGAPKKSEAAAVPLDEPPPPEESNEPPRYFAAERESRFIDYNAPRESLLEFTQYHLPEESNEPTRYFAARREGFIDFTAPRESLLEFTQ